MCRTWKTSDRILLRHSRIHLSPLLLPNSSRIQVLPTGSRILRMLMVGSSRRMPSFPRRYLRTHARRTPILYQSRHQSFRSSSNYRSHDKRHSCFLSHIMASITDFLRFLYTRERHQIFDFRWLPSGILKSIVAGWTGLLLVSKSLPFFSLSPLNPDVFFIIAFIKKNICSLGYLFFFSPPLNRTIVTLNIISVIMLFYPSNPDILRTICTIPNVVFMNVMAARVFRNTILFSSCRDTDIQVSTAVLFQEV